MQKNVSDDIKKIVFTTRFLYKFKNVLRKIYDYKEYMDFLIVPSLSGKTTLSYLPLLSYTDRASEGIDDLLELSKGNNFYIKTLDFGYKNFKENDAVTLRIDIQDRSSDEVFQTSVKRMCRKSIRKSNKNNFTFSYGNSIKDIDDFYTIFSNTMHMHGTPVIDKRFFAYLAEEFENKILFCNTYYEKKIIASSCVLLDEEIAWAAWGGVDTHYRNKGAGYFTDWEMLKLLCDNYKNIKIYDFGRSPFKGSTYNYKIHFGAYPIKINTVSSKQEDIYSKYSLASNIWKKLPKGIVDFIGPKLCKYLVDL